MRSSQNESAFPIPIGQTAVDSQGMELRDWFAGMAMNGLISQADTMAIEKRLPVVEKAEGKE